MSRIVVSRHPNGAERLTAGWDRPLQSLFVDLYDEDGEYVDGLGLLGNGPCESPEHAERFLVAQGASPEDAGRCRAILASHRADNVGNVEVAL